MLTARDSKWRSPGAITDPQTGILHIVLCWQDEEVEKFAGPYLAKAINIWRDALGCHSGIDFHFLPHKCTEPHRGVWIRMDPDPTYPRGSSTVGAAPAGYFPRHHMDLPSPRHYPAPDGGTFEDLLVHELGTSKTLGMY